SLSRRRRSGRRSCAPRRRRPPPEGWEWGWEGGWEGGWAAARGRAALPRPPPTTPAQEEGPRGPASPRGQARTEAVLPRACRRAARRRAASAGRRAVR
ncbi:hypothetical protein EMIHUDRAFT_442537, partial [Emiliania huxleyi CCMP1516]|uniref:Uncharacterized protein n=2 Tax=Emiliania huxleyi TaxID=2903 RepID=A0A0D3K3U3_EMIH1